MQFETFFSLVTGNHPYPYQSRLATGDRLPDVVHVPTGVGKTAAVVLAWIWRRRFAPDQIRMETPRRLVYCLPQRVLVEQTYRNIQAWVEAVSKIEDGPSSEAALYPLPARKPISVHLLMGGDVDNGWEMHPDEDVVLVGTQDQLLSRALNRGYSVSRYKWPAHFALLSNDVLWVVDELQLADVGLWTTTQLQAFRERFGTYGPAHTLWMSATFHPEWLNTVDFRHRASELDVLRLNEEDAKDDSTSKIVMARKLRVSSDVMLTKENSKKDGRRYATAVAKLVARYHVSGTLTLVVVNRVSRAQRIFEAVKQVHPDGNVLLIHSRFRAHERRQQMEKLGQCAEQDCIVIATQAVEAGVDVSAQTLITELAPWPSLIQRFGRCNRRGEQADAKVVVIDLEDQADLLLPYDSAEIQKARALVESLDDVGPQSLPNVDVSHMRGLVLRKKDLLDFFDTSPDLSGADVDVSRYIRHDRDVDVQVYWRKMDDNQPDDAMRKVSQDELCPVSLSQLRAYFKVKAARERQAWIWDNLDGRFVRVRPEDVYPGQMLLLDADLGGYLTDVGFVPESITPVPSLATPSSQSLVAYDEDPETELPRWVELHDHLAHVLQETNQLLRALPFDLPAEPIQTAAKWHDYGKAFHVFQDRLERRPDQEGVLLAKAPFARTAQLVRGDRPGFRHEWASALAYLAYERYARQGARTQWVQLAAYLIAAHHGKVRVSVRSLPTECPPPNPETLYARGVWQGDVLPTVTLGDGTVTTETIMDLRPMQLGFAEDGMMSWTAMVLQLLDTYGPFRLAYLETLVRIADWRASAKESNS
ncbi:MAG: CRISPR-associated helicase Cas3' [Alicyclobacillus herbarius]|uniref:type I-G CRISPR-associated helicase/endonuclease Cas3g n=1 Tax=Alicyclobacillus herbarius TaxID=122960 RepID=UPI0023565E42|nr:CRISPR-associated helicase Cas3' [Alicyclobacillus herbarius]MCL6633681.1 CRISPR-associated helicase Cas3' [Alicyclobacillus herbarius]